MLCCCFSNEVKIELVRLRLAYICLIRFSLKYHISSQSNIYHLNNVLSGETIH